jgi:hypothetical protein
MALKLALMIDIGYSYFQFSIHIGITLVAKCVYWSFSNYNLPQSINIHTFKNQNVHRLT